MSDSCIETMALIHIAQKIVEREGVTFPEAVDRLLGPILIPFVLEKKEPDKEDGRSQRPD